MFHLWGHARGPAGRPGGAGPGRRGHRAGHRLAALPAPAGGYGYQDFPEVVTLPELIRLLAETPASGDTLVFNGRPIRHLALIHCVGSRQIPGVHEENEDGYLNEYCSRTCCSATLYAANLIRKLTPNPVFDFYRDIRTFGRGQEELYAQASQNRVLFFRFVAGEEPKKREIPTPSPPCWSR